MVLGSRVDGGGQAISLRVRKTIQSIREIVGNHSEAEIYAVLKESNMDPNETAQKLLNQDPFHVVKRKRDRKKENSGQTAEWTNSQHNGQNPNRFSAMATNHLENTRQWTKSQPPSDQNTRRGGYARNALPGVTREFRVVRDNRVNQNSNGDAKQESLHCAASGNEQASSNIPEKSSQVIPKDQEPLATKSGEQKLQSQGLTAPVEPNTAHGKGADSIDTHMRSEGTRSTVSNTTLDSQKEFQSSKLQSPTLASSSSAVGLYSTSSDPVHVPSPDSRSVGTVGAIRREVGAVGVRRPSSDLPTSVLQTPVPNNPLPVPRAGRDVSTSSGSVRHTPTLPKSSQFRETPVSEPAVSTISTSKSFSSTQYGNRVHQQPTVHQKATQSNMEWKPKASQKPSSVTSSVTNAASVPSSHAENSTGPNIEMALSDKLSQVDVSENEYVIIPRHLRVPEGERTQLTFGSFGALDSAEGYESAFQAFGNVEDSINEASVSASSSVLVESNEGSSAEGHIDLTEASTETSRLHSSDSAADSEQRALENTNSLGSQNAVSYMDTMLVPSQSPSYSPKEHLVQNSTSLPKYSEAYDSQHNYEGPFFRAVIDDNVGGQGLASQAEVLSSHSANSSIPSTVGIAQQQPLVQQQVGQLYPQMQFSHFANYMPYRQLLSPLYVPPMAVPNYSNNPAYSHPSNGSSYLVMSGGNPHLTAGGMKYTPPQYKPVPAGSPTGYGNYTNAAGYAITTPGTVGTATGLDEVTRIKYKDNNLYVPNPQVDTSELWIQTPRDIPGMQSAPYYNMSVQGPTHAYMPTHTGHASFNAAAQPSHIQFSGAYHPAQPAAIPNPHHLVHQQVSPGIGGSVGVGMAAPAPQVGAYQQPQLGHLNWTSNF